jgi:hypothetical protein
MQVAIDFWTCGEMRLKVGGFNINPLNAELNPTCYLLSLLGAHPIFHISRIRVNGYVQHFLFITDKVSGFVELWAEMQFWTQHSSLMLGKCVGAFVQVHQSLFYTLVLF